MPVVKMRVWDVKHGLAIFILTPNDKTLVIDLGKGDYSEKSNDRSPLYTIRYHYKIKTIDHLTVTHPHRDHIDDILNLDVYGIRVATFRRPKHIEREDVMNDGISEEDRPKYEKYFEMDESYNSSVTGTSRDTNIPENLGGLDIKRFITPSLPKGNLNNHSIFTVLEYETTKVLIPGDNEWESLEELMKNKAFRKAITNCDILIAPHHGRESAYHAEFVKLASPSLTIISDSERSKTSSNDKYSKASSGWVVIDNGEKTNRKLLTTNRDGEIYVDFGRNQSDGSPFLQVLLKRL